ncbi:ABC transporter substrate-binding protein [Paenibacillus oleatilyticus]|uniref:ABC transporter substrate-binding protein n=1 Tax=Paenibacillus oleatilyticus TaxID=2594886 RepID=UPI001C1FEF4D|nr:ABC transporter substrate-binding protein [Paenibacillus oleatilyticus]MBU7319992.1 ABC transporter substrate-binding protein [Paenibacillus oleatilyticus]
MKALMRLFISIALVAGILAGCGGTPEPNHPSAANSTAPAKEGSATPEKAGQETGTWPRTYVDALGREIVLEKKPEKVALLFFRNFEHLFLLDESPVAATDLNVLKEWESLAPYKDKPIADIGSMTSPNLDKLVEIGPDLIIMVSGRYGSYGDKLEKIAPVVTVDSNENNWQGALQEYGKIFGKEQKAKDEISRIETLIADSKEQLKTFSDKTFGVIMLGDKQFWGFTTQFVFNKESGLALNPPSKYADMSTKGEQISLEGLAAMNPDYMFVADIGGSSKKLQGYLKNLESDSAWNSLQAIKNGHMYALDSSIAAGGPLGIELGVKTIVKHILAK